MDSLINVFLQLALINSYRLLATTQILRAVELAPGQRTKIYLFIRCTSPAACSPHLNEATTFWRGDFHSHYTHRHRCAASTNTQTQVAIHTRTLAVSKFRQLSFERANEACGARARRTAAGGERTLPPAHPTTCSQLFALKSSTDKK